MKLFEIYAKDHRELYDYLKSYNSDDEKIDILVDNFRGYVDQYFEDAIGIYQYNEENNTDYDDFSELSKNDILELISELNSTEISNLVNSCLSAIISDRNPEDMARIPSRMVFDSRNIDILPRDTWLIHFSNNAKQIYNSGFKYGINNKEFLAYTEYNDIADEIKSREGWNFAINIDNIDNVVIGKKYGNSAVMFQSSGIEALHTIEMDREVIFQGKYIKPRDMVYVNKQGDEWCVVARNDRIVYKNKDIRNVVTWVKQHYQQYRKVFQ